MSDGYPARAVQERADLLTETRRQQETIDRLERDVATLTAAMRWMLADITVHDVHDTVHDRLRTTQHESITNLARHSGVDPQRLRELLEVKP